MTISIATSVGTSTQPITRITKNEFIVQGYDIVQAYADKYRVTALHPYHGAGQLADFVWKRFADENGTIPLLQEHTAVRLSNGHLRIVARVSDSEGSTTPPMLGTIVDDSYPPNEPPELDENHVFPIPLHRPEEPPLSCQIIPLPSAPKDTYSPRSLLFTEPPSGQDHDTPKLDLVYPPITRATGEQIGFENLHSRWITELMEQARKRRQKLLQLFDEVKAELASAILELQQTRNELDMSVAESQKTMDNLRSLFGTERALQVMNVKEEMIKKRDKASNEDGKQSSSASSHYDYDNDNTESDSRPYTWSSRDSSSASDRETLKRDAIHINATDHFKRIIGEMNNVQEVDTLSVHWGSSMEGISSFSPRSLSGSLHSSLGKHAREEEEDLDSETEVEASVLYDDNPLEESPKKIRLDQAGTSVRASPSRRSSLKQSRNMDVDSSSSRSAHRVRFAENPVPMSNTSSSRHNNFKSESPPQSKGFRTSSTQPGRCRPLTRSTSQILPAEDGGLYYIKYYPPKSKETSH